MITNSIRYQLRTITGYYAIENRMTIHDLHATILHLLGIDHLELTYQHVGRDFRLTHVYGEVATDILD